MVLGLIPARGGSKGIKNKNIRYLLGKPLIAYAVQCGLACNKIDKLVVSTDSEEIAEIARECGADVPFIRPAELAGDETPMMPVMQHCIETVEAMYREKVNVLVLLDSTSPLRKVEDIEGALSLFSEEGSCEAVISGCRAHNNPYFNMITLMDGYARLVIPTDIGRRQDCPPVYDLDTTVWVYSRRAIMEIGQRIPPHTRFYSVPEERSVHIDTEIDFKIVEYLMSQS